mgnify:CR=1 FL=1
MGGINYQREKQIYIRSGSSSFNIHKANRLGQYSPASVLTHRYSFISSAYFSLYSIRDALLLMVIILVYFMVDR